MRYLVNNIGGCNPPQRRYRIPQIIKGNISPRQATSFFFWTSPDPTDLIRAKRRDPMRLRFSEMARPRVHPPKRFFFGVGWGGGGPKIPYKSTLRKTTGLQLGIKRSRNYRSDLAREIRGKRGYGRTNGKSYASRHSAALTSSLQIHTILSRCTRNRKIKDQTSGRKRLIRKG